MDKNSLSDWAKTIIGFTLTIALIVLTAKRIIPVEVFIGVAPAVIIYIVKEWEKKREIARIMKQLEKK